MTSTEESFLIDLYNRRNQIAHQADHISGQQQKQSITKNYVEDFINKIDNFVMANNNEVVLQIANIYKRHNESKYLNIWKKNQKLTGMLEKYNPKKIHLVFHGRDIKVEENDKTIALNAYADSLFTSFSIDSPEFENKKGVFVFTVDSTVVYVGMTNGSLKKVIMGTYGNIISRKLHKDGQLTACRLNTFLNSKYDRNIELWFIECNNKEKNKQIKNELIATYRPEINTIQR